MRPTVRVLAAGVVTAAVVLTTAGPAWADPPVVEWRAPTVDQRFDIADVTVDATVKMPNGGTLRGTATLSFTSPEGHPVPAPLDVATGNQATKAITHTVSLPWNGPYTAHIRATGRDGPLDTTDETSTPNVNFVVDAAPAPPADVRTVVDDESRTVTVSWAANGEPDMVGYEIQRQRGSHPWEQLTVTGRSTTTVVDDAPSSTGGTYRYRVVAFRESGTPGQGIASAPSATSTALVAAPPTTTTTTAPDDDEGGTDGGTTGGTTGGSKHRPRTGTTDGGTTTTGPGGRTSSGSGGRSAPLLATRGKVDLSGFAQLLEQARAAGAHAADRAEEADGGYNERLPFSSRTTIVRTGSEQGEEQVLVSEPIGDGDNRLQSMAFVAGGLLATVLLMHVLWVRAELRRADELEALLPEGDVPAGDDTTGTADADPWSRHLAAALARFHARPPARKPATPAPEDDPEHVVVG